MIIIKQMVTPKLTSTKEVLTIKIMAIQVKEHQQESRTVQNRLRLSLRTFTKYIRLRLIQRMLQTNNRNKHI